MPKFKARRMQRISKPINLAKFESGEHDEIYNEILKGLNSDKQYILMPNEIDLTFPDIIMLFGDYFAIPDLPICGGIGEKEQIERFKAAFRKLAEAPRQEIKKILGIVDDQLAKIQEAMSHGKPEDEAVKDFAFQEMIRATWDTGGRFLNISIKNIDHFGENAKIAHNAAHKAAIEMAIEAHGYKDPAMKARTLALAYAMEAAGLHYFTDAFAAGHIRTPRRALDKEHGHLLGAGLAYFMHKEDNKNGLEVINNNKDEWKAYGDGELFEEKSKPARDIIKKAIEMSVKEVHTAYITGHGLKGDSEAYKYLPRVNASKPQTTPLFENDPQEICIKNRKDLADPFHVSGTEVSNGVLLFFRLLFTSFKPEPILEKDKGIAKEKSQTSCFGLFGKNKKKSEVLELGVKPHMP